MNADSPPPGSARQTWENALAPLLVRADGALWRTHCDELNAVLLRRWLADMPGGHILKTDLYDEAVGAGLYPLLARVARAVVGIDLAANIAAAATARHTGLQAVQADVRCLPFPGSSFDTVLSNSTLDHFDTRAEIEAALAEIHRVLRRGGRLLITMDNLANPAVALRNALPLSWLRRCGIVPYPVGATYGPWRLRRALTRSGFETIRRASLLHCPRAWAVARAARLEVCARPGARQAFLRRLMHWERLGALPTHYLTGYFVAALAVKR